VRHPITFAKLCGITAGIVVIVTNWRVHPDTLKPAILLLPLMGYAMWKHRVWLLVPIFIALLIAGLSFRLNLKETPANAPEQWFSLTAESPIYNQSIVANLRVEKAITPGIYLSSVRIESTGWKMRRRRGWIDSPSKSADFPVLLLLKGADFYEGCEISARIYGHGVPQRLTDSSFHQFARNHGSTSLLRLSPRYNVISAKCPAPDLRTLLRTRIKTSLRQNLTGRSLDSAMGFVLGQAGYMDRDLKNRASELGILHIFAASGMHLAVLYAILFFPAASILGRKHPFAAVAPLPICLFYVWLLEFPISICRAMVFVSLYAFSCLMHRRLTAKDALLNSAIILMILMPDDFATLSSALSFGAVAGILFFTEPLAAVFQLRWKFIEKLWKQCIVTLCAGILTTPILVFSFGSYSFLGPIANLALVPLSDLVLPVLFLAVFAQMVSLPDPFASAIWFLARSGLDIFVRVAEMLAPFSLFHRYEHLVSIPVILSLALLALLLWTRSRPWLCGRALFIMRRSVFLVVALLGPFGAAMSGLLGPFLPTLSGRRSTLFESERIRMQDEVLSSLRQSGDNGADAGSDNH